MTKRAVSSVFAISALNVLIWMAPADVAAQGSSDQAWTPPKTPWGHPDIQGLWPSTEWRGVPTQRPEEFGTRDVLTDAEYAERLSQAQADAEADSLEFQPEDARIGNSPPPYWLDRGSPQRQASLVVDPPNGRIPPLTPGAEERRIAAQEASRGRPAADSWEDRSLYERCITRGMTNFMPTLYNNGNQILQTPNYVVIRHEMINETRIVPLDGRPFSGIRTHMGESRGHWEGNTLVVETTNYLTERARVNGAQTTDDLRIIERFTRLDAHTLQYEATVEDPGTWTQPWTMAFAITEDPDYPLFEYACHEGNYAMVNILSGARAEEAAAAAAGN